MKFDEIFSAPRPIIGCIHLAALPGSPGFAGSIDSVLEKAIADARLLEEEGCDGLIVENFGDSPFYPGAVPPVTVSAMTIAVSEIRKTVKIRVGVNVLRNDAASAISIAACTGADFIRVNVHLHAVVADQGILSGAAHETLRLKRYLGARCLIFADAAVKHASPLGSRDLKDEIADLGHRGMVDAIVVSGTGTGQPADVGRLKEASEATTLPILLGSGVTKENLTAYTAYTSGAIVGSTLNAEGKAGGRLDRERARAFMQAVRTHWR